MKFGSGNAAILTGVLELAALALVVLPSSLAHGTEPIETRIISVRAYSVGWDISTVRPLRVEDVIRMKRIYFEINDHGLAMNFAGWLRLSDLRERESTEPGNARLVIELREKEGGAIVFYADRDYLYTEDSKRARKIEGDFRDRFDLASPEFLDH